MKQYFVYMMSNTNRTVLYTGVTNDIVRRVFEHRSSDNRGFTARYQCVDLVYYEEYNDIWYAIAREKQLKNWKREWKDELVAKMNPLLADLAADWL